jgi:hypothetical protein
VRFSIRPSRNCFHRSLQTTLKPGSGSPVTEYIYERNALKGMGYEAGCTVSAVKVSLPQLNIWEYVRCDIHLAPENLPDGSYEVSFEGRTMQVKKLDGDWLDGSP